MNTEEFAAFLGDEGVATVRTGEPERCGNHFARTECLPTGFALILAVTAIVVIDVMMRGTTKRTDGVFRNGFTITALNWFDRLAIFPVIVFKEELPVLFDKGFDDRELINLEFLVFW